MGVFGSTLILYIDEIILLLNELLYWFNLLTDGFGNIVDVLKFFVDGLHPILLGVFVLSIITLFLRKILGIGHD